MKAQKTITQEINELRSMRVPDLVERYETLYGKPPRTKHREHLWRRIAWKIQEQRFGGLSQVAKQKLDELIAEIDLPLPQHGQTVGGALPRSSKPGMPAIGTDLIREWRGTEVRVTVVEGGVEHDGIRYRSLSAVVKAITGSHCSGPAWFGLTGRPRGGQRSSTHAKGNANALD